MAEDVIVASYDTAAKAADAVRELEGAGIASSAIHRFDQQHPAWDSETGHAGTTERRTGFWASLFGDDEAAATDHRVYDETVTRGGMVVSVTVPAGEHERVMDILERHSPTDLDEHAASASVAGTSGTGATGMTGVDPSASATLDSTAVTGRDVGGTGAPIGSQATAGVIGTRGAVATGDASTAGRTRDGEQVIGLAEEQLQVGKRVVETGRTRIRRYVVETPVEERVRLRTERVTIERRRPISGKELSPDAFTETTTEVVERGEEAVVGKTARVGEEVVIHTEQGEREETVRDTVRREDVEVTRDGTSASVRGAPAERDPTRR